MGQIFNRAKRLIRANLGYFRDSLLGKVKENDFLREKWEASQKWGADRSEDLGREWDGLRDKWNNATSSVPYSLKGSYETLGVPFGADLETVRKAWRNLMMKNHPDRFQNPKLRDQATKKTAAINEAFQKIENFWKNAE